MNVLPSSWAFKVKRFPDGTIKKFKSRFLVGGHRQIHAVNFFNFFAPVINRASIRFLLVLTARLDLASKQVDWTTAFVHVRHNMHSANFLSENSMQKLNKLTALSQCLELKHAFAASTRQTAIANSSS